MKKVFTLLFLCTFLFIASFVIVPKSSSDQLDDITKQINDLTSALNMSINATKPLQSQLDSLKSQISDIKNRVAAIEQGIAIKKKNIDQGYADLAKEEIVLNRTIRDYYIKSYYNSPLLMFLSGASASELTQILAYQKAATDQDKVIITNIAITVQSLEEKKKILENEQIKLISIKATLDDQSAKLDKIVTGAKAYQSNLSGQIAQLNAIQQQILSQRLGALNIPLYASSGGACSSDIGKDPGFGGAKFGFFTFGVPNRVGLNQYGAFGRAKAGKSYEEILRAYYNFDSLETKDAQISVQGYSTYSLEDYTKRIYEVPDSWGSSGGMEALKAQAIAARSYALAYTNNGSGSICTTEQCQVFKPDPKGGNWEQAVNDTAGKVMIQGGNPIKAWFSSTHGGYVFNSGDIGWSGTSFTKNAVDTPSGSVGSFSELQSNAYDKDSPWFYCDWGSRADYNKTAWLKPEEVADIVNVLFLAQKDSSTVNHLYQTDKPNPAGTDTWNSDRVKQELGSKAYNSISDISVSADFGSGKTTNVTVSGDGKSDSFSADIFVTYFDLRAPATIYIPQLGKNSDGSLKSPLFNVER